MSAQTTPPLGRITAALWAFFGVPFRAETYRHLAYLILAFPLGMAYFVGIAVGLSVGTGLLVTVVGVPILLVTLYLTTVVAGVEASLARQLVGVDVRPPAILDETRARATDTDAGALSRVVDWTRRLLAAPTTWTALLLVGAKFLFGVVAFTALVATVAFSGSLLSAPLLYREPSIVIGVTEPTAGSGGVVGVTKRSAADVIWAVDSLPEAVGATIVGVLGLLVALHLLSALAKLGGLLTAALLDVGRPLDEGDSAT